MTRLICQNIYPVSRAMSFSKNIIALIGRWINFSLVIKFSLKIGMGMVKPVV